MMGGMTGRRSPFTGTRVPALVGALAVVLGLGACSTDGAEAGSSRPVVTSFYPLQFATQQIVGSTTPVTVLTKRGPDPPARDPAPQDRGGMTKARLVISPGGSQPAVDEAVG